MWRGWGWRQELADERALLQGRAGERERLGRRRPEQGCRAAVAASSWLAGAVARGSWRVAVRRGARGAALQIGPNPGARRGGSGVARAKRMLCSRPEHARNVLDKMPGHARGLGCGWGFNRPRLKLSRGLVDRLVFPEVQGHSAMTKVMSKLFMHSRCLTKCHRHLGISWSGQNFQSGVSLDVHEGGEVSWPKAETC